MISVFNVKGYHFSVSIPLCLLFNRSWSNVNFLFNGNSQCTTFTGDLSLLSNYRPVSLLCWVSKIMERVLFKNVYKYFYSIDLFYKYQAGFFAWAFNCVTAHWDLYIDEAIDEGKYCCMVFCDLSKGFDRVWHKGFIYKLQSYGISGNIFNWCESYPIGRCQRLYREIHCFKYKFVLLVFHKGQF